MVPLAEARLIVTGTYACFLVLAAVVTFLLTRSVRRYAIRRRILDVPNHRSAHSMPTPRGGGVAISVVVGGAVVAAALLGLLEPRTTIALLGGGAAVATIGWMDDRRGLRPRTRAMVHLLAATWAVAWIGLGDGIQLGSLTVSFGSLTPVLAVLAIAWCINLYNFMDGIDGLAGVEALCVAGAGGLMLAMAGATGLAAIAFAVCGAAAGFLWWNWSPARIFLGDVGSGLFGFLFGALALASERVGALPASLWLVLLGVFVFDATVTLARRLLRGEDPAQAHRDHAYQRATRAGASHAQVAAAAFVLNVLLAVLAWAAWRRAELAPLALATAPLLLAGLYLRVEAAFPMVSGASRTERPRG